MNTINTTLNYHIIDWSATGTKLYQSTNFLIMLITNAIINNKTYILFLFSVFMGTYVVFNIFSYLVIKFMNRFKYIRGHQDIKVVDSIVNTNTNTNNDSYLIRKLKNRTNILTQDNIRLNSRLDEICSGLKAFNNNIDGIISDINHMETFYNGRFKSIQQNFIILDSNLRGFNKTDFTDFVEYTKHELAMLKNSSFIPDSSEEYDDDDYEYVGSPRKYN